MSLLIDDPHSGFPDTGSSAGKEAQTDLGSPQRKANRPLRLGRLLASEGGALFLSFSVVYLTIAWLYDWKYLLFEGDSITRVSNAFYVLHSRDPHLAAIGFVWGPLSSAADLPLVLFNSYWPALTSHDVAGTTVSAVAMAGAVYQLNSLLREWKVRTTTRLILTLFFACNPMILVYSGNGMSEALYLFTMLAATRYLMRWLRNFDLASLVYAGSALGLAYLDRSEPVASALLAGPFVLWVAYVRSTGSRRNRMWAGLTDATILVMPIVTCFVAWAFMSYVVTGQPFQQFTSKYGNSALIAASHIPKGHYVQRVIHEIQSIGYLSPAIPIIVLGAVGVAVYRRNAQIWVVATILGGGLTFTLLSYLNNSIFPFYRYYVLVTPIAVLLVGSIFSDPVRIHKSTPPSEVPFHRPIPSPAPHAHRSRPTIGAFAATLVGAALLVPSIPGTAFGMNSPKIDPEFYNYYGYVFHTHLTASDKDAEDAYPAVKSIANYIDELHLKTGDLVADTAVNCIPGVVTNVNHPKIFVITNDRDFQRVLDDPLTFHAHYLIASSGSLSIDAVSTQYPSLDRGVGWATRIHTFSARGLCPKFAMYKVTGHPQGSF